jgi:hypothetical protein
VCVSDHTPTQTLSPTTGQVTTEGGGPAEITFVLDSKPYSSVSIPVSSSDASEGTASKSSVEFTVNNWDTPQTVVVTGVDDFIIDGDIIYTIETGVFASTDSNFNGEAVSDVTVTNTDGKPFCLCSIFPVISSILPAVGDLPSATVIPTTGLGTTEAGTVATFTVALDSEPDYSVSVPVSSGDTSEGTVSTQLDFSVGNWDTPQTVSVTAVDDVQVDGDITYTVVLAAFVSSDTNFNGEAVADVTITNDDRKKAII